MRPLFLFTADKNVALIDRDGITQENKECHAHPTKAARTVAPCWVFSIVQRKDRPSHGTAWQGFLTGGAGRLPGKPEQNAVPMKGDIMAIARAGNRFPASADKHHILSVHTAVPSKGAAGFFYSTHFYLIPGHNTKEYMVFVTGVPAIVRVRFFCALVYAPYRARAPPLQS